MSIPRIYGKVEYQHYNVVESRINNFPDTEILGKDASGNYDLHLIHLGDKTKPKILVTSSVHGSEWEGTQYSLDFFEKIRDNTYPDKNFRDILLSNFHILYIPVVNPYGYDIPMDSERIRKDGRENFNGIDLNRDFYEANPQAETIIVKSVIDEYKPFAFLDTHLRTALGSNLELHNSHEETSYIRNKFAQMWEEYTGETLVINAVSGSTTGGTHRGLAINYVRDSENPYTPYTLSFLTEVGHYDNNVNGNSREAIYFYGISSMYAFFFVSVNYFMEYNDYNLTGGEERVYKIEQNHKTTHFYRDIEGHLIRVKEEFVTGDIIITDITRDDEGNVLSFDRALQSVQN